MIVERVGLWKQAASVTYAEPQSVYALSGEFNISQRPGKSPWGIVRVPNSLVRGLFDATDMVGAELPGGDDGTPYQAHISVIRPEEVESVGGPDKFTERGKRFRYQLGPVREVEPAGWDEMSKCWFVEVRSPDLIMLRRSYGLPSYPIHPRTGTAIGFHITFAVRRRGVLGVNETAKRT